MRKPLRVLLLEDDPQDVELELRELRRSGLEVTPFVVDNRDDFLAALRDLGPEVVISDYRMPRFDGLSALELARHEAPDIPFIFVSGTLGEERAIETLETGATDYILKDRLMRLGPAVQRAVTEAHERRERRRVEENLIRSTFTDAFTGLPNRARFIEGVVHALDLANRLPGYRFAILALDLDRFGLVNESLGRALGDQLLKTVARRLQAAARAEDMTARLGEDTFAVLLQDLASAEEATALAEKMQRVIAEPFALGTRDVVATASIGIVHGRADYEGAEEMLRDAEAAMYAAKEVGRGRIALFTPTMRERSTARFELEGRLRRAIETEAIVLHYQPILTLSQGRLVGGEALARWTDTFRGAISPSEFIPLAEEIGLILPLGEWVLREACRRGKAWSDAGRPICVAVNLSARQFRHPDLVALVREVLEASALPPALLKLELTESVIMDDVEEAGRILNQLAAIGVGLSLDDFGTGYSSLAHLKRFPFRELKIDRSFVCDLPGDAEAAAIATAIVSMGHDLKRHIVAEGIETEAQHAFLASLGCDEGQGFLFGKPLPADAFSRFALAS